MTKVRLPANNTVVSEERAKRLTFFGLIEIDGETTPKRAMALNRCIAQRAPSGGGRRFVIAHEDGRYSVATITPFARSRPAARTRREEPSLFGGAA